MTKRNGFLRTLSGFIRKELIQALRDPRMRIVLFLLPMVQMVVFGLAISNDVKNVRLAAQFKPNDRLSQELYERSIASGWFVPARVTGEDPFGWIQTDQADAVIVSPTEGLARSIEREDGRLQLLVNATNVIRAQGVESYMQSLLVEVTQQYRPAKGRALQLDVRILYNPSMESTVFMVPGVMSLILCVVTILLTSMSLAREKEMGTFETIISAPVSTSEVLLGKTIPYVVLGMLDIPLIMAVAFFLFGVPMRGSLWVTAFAGFVFVCTTVAIGTLISTFSKSQQQAMMGGFIFLFVATLLSGIMFPLENMPLPMLIVAHLNPLKYFVVLLRNIMLKGGDLHVVWVNVSALTLMCLIAVTVAFRRFKPTLT
jgi:ABC-2 type transport system permease protein